MLFSLPAADSTGACVTSDTADIATNHPNYYNMILTVVTNRTGSGENKNPASGVQLAPGMFEEKSENVGVL